MKKTNDTTQGVSVTEVHEENAQQATVAIDEAEVWKSKYMRALADYQNLERRNREEKADVYKFANEVLLSHLFSALDTLKKAKDHLSDAGLDLAYKELMSVLTEHGVEQIKTVGLPFDPHDMECIEVVDLPEAAKEDQVVEELAPGYRLHGKLLRVAKVKVGKQNAK
jgi:molecular chaperone GrpE